MRRRRWTERYLQLQQNRYRKSGKISSSIYTSFSFCKAFGGSFLLGSRQNTVCPFFNILQISKTIRQLVYAINRFSKNPWLNTVSAWIEENCWASYWWLSKYRVCHLNPLNKDFRPSRLFGTQEYRNWEQILYCFTGAMRMQDRFVLFVDERQFLIGWTSWIQM